MKKFINTIIISSFLGLNFIYANSIQNSLESQIATNKISIILQNDINFLFNDANQVDVALLDNEEMMETKGEFFGPLLGRILFGIGSWHSIVIY